MARLRPESGAGATGTALCMVLLLTLLSCTSKLLRVHRDETDPEVVVREKCSSCHDLQRVLHASEDERAWLEIIQRMQGKAGSTVQDRDVEKLVSFHVNRQQREQELFNDRCTGCHPAERALDRVRTQAAVREVVLQMMAKRDEPIVEGEVDLLIGFHMRNYRRMEQALNTSCTRCHDLERVLALAGDDERVQSVIAEMVSRSDHRISSDDVFRLVEFHQSREHASRLAVFERECNSCHEFVHRNDGHGPWRLAEERLKQETGEFPDPDNVKIRVSYHRDARRIESTSRRR
jgi:cytochrome c2